jgi:hypothetical protein
MLWQSSLSRGIPFNELSHGLGLLIHYVMHAVLDDSDLDVCAPMHPQSLGQLGMSFSKGEFSPGASTNGAPIALFCAALNFSFAGKARYISNSARRWSGAA